MHFVSLYFGEKSSCSKKSFCGVLIALSICRRKAVLLPNTVRYTLLQDPRTTLLRRFCWGRESIPQNAESLQDKSSSHHSSQISNSDFGTSVFLFFHILLVTARKIYPIANHAAHIDKILRRVDTYITEAILEMNRADFVTTESCSGLKQDHEGKSPFPAYVCFDDEYYLDMSAHLFTLADAAWWVPCFGAHGFDVLFHTDAQGDKEVMRAWDRLEEMAAEFGEYLEEHRNLVEPEEGYYFYRFRRTFWVVGFGCFFSMPLTLAWLYLLSWLAAPFVSWLATPSISLVLRLVIFGPVYIIPPLLGGGLIAEKLGKRRDYMPYM